MAKVNAKALWHIWHSNGFGWDRRTGGELYERTGRKRLTMERFVISGKVDTVNTQMVSPEGGDIIVEKMESFFQSPEGGDMIF